MRINLGRTAWQSATLLAALVGCAAPPRHDLPVIPRGVASRAISWENRSGAVGAGGQSKDGRKGSPCIPLVANGETVTLMDVGGCGVIRHIWLTIPDRSPEALRNMILRMYWDDSAVASVEAPLGDFFGIAHGQTAPLTTAYTTMTLGRGFNCYFDMPFRKHAKVTIQNDLPDGRKMEALFFQIDYELRDSLPSNTGYFHAQFRRQNPTVMQQDFVVLDDVQGPGYFLGCVIGVRGLGPEWWGEGEMKFYLDGDAQWPTICGTGTEDYFGGAWGMDSYQTPWHGCPVLLKPPAVPFAVASMYRFHVSDPVYFRESLKATIQQIGWKSPDGLFERSDDWCSTAYWYQARPNARMAALPDRAARTASLPAAAK